MTKYAWYQCQKELEPICQGLHYQTHLEHPKKHKHWTYYYYWRISDLIKREIKLLAQLRPLRKPY